MPRLDVSRSGYFEAQRRVATPAVCKQRVYMKAAFMASHQSYGSRRLATAMANEGFQIGRYKVRSLMRQADLRAVWKRKFVHTTDSKHDLPIAPNVLDRQFNRPAWNVAYVSDITYIRTGAGRLYLATVLDCEGVAAKYAAMNTLRLKYPVSVLCRVFGVSRSGFYAWARGKPSQRAQDDKRLKVAIKALHEQRRQTYGPLRMQPKLAQGRLHL